jgi:glycosyltransferase involved in cell wall biosynthesis
VLEQYPPRPLVLSKKYTRKSTGKSVSGLPSLSLVTPSYNQRGYIERTLRSVLSQFRPGLEYIVQDGNSTDGTPAVLAAYAARITRVDSRPDNGQAHALNLGFAKSTGDIMGYINSDDLVLPGALEYVVRYFARHPQVDVVYSHRIVIDPLDREIGRWILPPHEDGILEWADYVPQETLYWRREIWERTGGYLDESFRFAMDWELLLRFRAAGGTFKRLPRFLGAFRVHRSQKTRTQMATHGISEMDRLRRQTHGREVGMPEVQERIAPYLRRSLYYHFLHRLGVLRY